MFCGDVVVSGGTGGLIFYGLKLYFMDLLGFIYVFSCAVVGWAFPVVDNVSFLSIWNWTF